MPGLACSLVRVFTSPPALFPLYTRWKQKKKQSKQGGRNLLIRRLTSRKFTAAASCTGPVHGVTKIQVRLWVWQTLAPGCGDQGGMCRQALWACPSTVCLWTLLQSTLLSEGAIAVQLLGGILLFPAHATQNWINRIAISCSSCRCRGKKPEGNSGFGLSSSCGGWELLVELHPFKRPCHVASWTAEGILLASTSLWSLFSLLFSLCSDRSETFLNDP